MTVTSEQDLGQESDHPDPVGRVPLRRSETDRVVAGVCGGLGEYLDVDPVLLRIAVATAAFFGVGIVAYGAAWLCIPSAGGEEANRLARLLRRGRFPIWAIATVIGLVAWIRVWHSPWGVPPLVAGVAVLVVVAATQRHRRLTPMPAPAPSEAETVPLVAPAQRMRSEVGAWLSETRAEARRRRARRRPVMVVSACVLAASLVALGLADVTHGIAIPVYGWVVGGIALLALLIGAVLDRTPWPLVILLPVAICWLVAFGNTHASLHDGFGERVWQPATAGELQPRYDLAFGDAQVYLPPNDSSAHTVQVRAAAGRIRIVVPQGGDVVVQTRVHLGTYQVDHRGTYGGALFTRTYRTGPASPGEITVNVEMGSGDVEIDDASANAPGTS